jgi:hypothetical protein
MCSASKFNIAKKDS